MGVTGLSTASSPCARRWAYLGLGDGAVQGVVLLVVEQAEVQRAQGGCGQGGLRSPRGHTGEKRHPALRSQTKCHGVHADCHRLGTYYLSSIPHPGKELREGRPITPRCRERWPKSQTQVVASEPLRHASGPAAGAGCGTCAGHSAKGVPVVLVRLPA